MNPQTIASIINNLWLFCRWTQVPCISPNTELFLQTILHTYKPKRVLEIGTAYGYGMLTMANILSEWWWSIIWCERAYPNRVEISKLLSLCRQYGLENIHCNYGAFLRLDPSLRGDGNQTYSNEATHGTTFDFVFIDAQKAEYPLYVDFIREHNLIDNNSILVFDDVIKYAERMSWLETQLSLLGYEIQKHHLDEDDGVIIARMRNS